jgi:hypothetical protein
VNEGPQQPEAQPRRSTTIFRAISYFQTVVFIAVFAFAANKMLLVTQGGAYGIGTLVFYVFFLPSLLLLIPDILLILYARKLSKVAQFLGYFFHTAALSWSFFLFKTALEN